jgi:peptidoglycan biosynthesis protein MviN/MurJ (putative lipid II flippase)
VTPTIASTVPASEHRPDVPEPAGGRPARSAGLTGAPTLARPGTIGLAATQVNIFVNTLLATSQGTGAVSWLTYTFRLMYLPIGLFGVSIGTAVLPAVSRHAAIDDVDGVRATVSRGRPCSARCPANSRRRRRLV